MQMASPIRSRDELAGCSRFRCGSDLQLSRDAQQSVTDSCAFLDEKTADPAYGTEEYADSA